MSIAVRTCSAHSSRTGEPCQHAPMIGQTVCRSHGGKAPAALRKASERQQIAKAQQTAAAMVVRFEGNVNGDPLHELLRMVKQAAMTERAYAHLIEYETGGKLLTAVDYGKAGGIREEPHPYLKLWTEERDRLSKFAKAALDAGVSTRLVELAEDEARATADLLLAVITDVTVAMPAEQQQRVRIAMATRLRAA